jgi:hypothetical protein
MKKCITSLALFSFLLATVDAAACDGKGGDKEKEKEDGKKGSSIVLQQQ